jgi:sporulation-control protein
VHPLPAQDRILDAFLRLGLRFSRADVERGRVYGVQQTLQFYQEIELRPAPRYARALNQLEVTFRRDPAAPAGGAGGRQARWLVHRGA